jgi:hypothetical protein
MAAAAAMVALEILLICIFGSSMVLERSGIAAHVKDPANAGIITQLSKLMSVSIARQRADEFRRVHDLDERFLMFCASAALAPPKAKIMLSLSIYRFARARPNLALERVVAFEGEFYLLPPQPPPPLQLPCCISLSRSNSCCSRTVVTCT